MIGSKRDKERHEARVSQALTKPDVMNLDDESFLSAYLDDELAPADRLAVEWSVETSLPRADRLRAIVLARDAVAGLDRPTIPRDLAPGLEAQLATNRHRAQNRSFLRPVRLALALSGFTTIAASLLFALIFLHRSLHDSADPVLAAAPFEPAQVPRNHSVDSTAADLAPIPASPISLVKDATDSPLKSPSVSPSGLLVSIDPPAPPVKAVERDDRRVMGGIMARPHVRRVLIVTDVIDAADQVQSLIARNGRETPDFGRISIRQELVIDPDHVQAAEVFAVPIDGRGCKSLVDQLHKRFPDLIEEGPSRPELVAHLSEVGQVAIYRGLEAAPLGDPPGDIPSFIAHREHDRVPLLFEADRALLDPTRMEKPGQAEIKRLDRSRPDDRNRLVFVGPPDFRQPAPKPGERVTLLVWVTHPGRR